MSTISFPKMFNNNRYATSVTLSDDITSINESLKSLLSTSPGELLGDPAWGCALKTKLFDIKNNVNMTELRNIITTAIDRYLPKIRVRQEDIKIYSNPNNNHYKITIRYTTNNIQESQLFETII